MLYDRILAKAWVSYALIGALQLKIVWNIWRYRDLTTGDTSSYFSMALRWAHDLAVNIVWSPLYAAFYGSVFMLTQDVYLATIFHRVIIVFAVSLCVLALMRQLLPPAMALLIAAWWTVLPINFETLYEVHLFAVLPILAAWLAAAADTKWSRGITLGIFLATIILVRNEMLVAAAIFAAICLVREILAWRSLNTRDRSDWPFWRARIAAYGIPFLFALCVCVAVYWRSYIKYPATSAALAGKHGLNMCQVYAFGYAQRHPEWTSSPWTECGPLLQSTFGIPWPSLKQMLLSNPHALLEHVVWNLSLTFNGLQVSLFNAMSGTINPYAAGAGRVKVVRSGPLEAG